MTTLGPIRFTLNLLRTPCAVCGLPAVQVIFHDEIRMVTHLGKRPCIITNPPEVPQVEAVLGVAA